MKPVQFVVYAVVGLVFGWGLSTGCKTVQDAAKATGKQASSMTSKAGNDAKNSATSMATDAKNDAKKAGGDAKAGVMGDVKSLIAALAGAKDKKQAAIQSLVAMGGKAVPALINALKTGSKETKQGALTVLGKMGSKAASAKSAVETVAKSEDATLKKQANETLTQIK